MADVCFYGDFHCGDCDVTWAFEPVEDGTLLWSHHECTPDNQEGQAE
ncbi:hypothetical protein [Streptomyces showdoensis]|nr:hypothetical protein [Streptomyces showdoensis]